MGIFDDVVVNAKSAAQTVSKMAGQFVDMSKLRINMSELNGEITKRYQELGRFIYEAKKAGSADEAELADQIAGIDDLYAQLSAVSAQYASMQNKVTCPACGKQMPTDSMFCSHCGAKLENAPAEPEEADPSRIGFFFLLCGDLIDDLLQQRPARVVRVKPGQH